MTRGCASPAATDRTQPAPSYPLNLRGVALPRGDFAGAKLQEAYLIAAHLERASSFRATLKRPSSETPICSGPTSMALRCKGPTLRVPSYRTPTFRAPQAIEDLEDDLDLEAGIGPERRKLRKAIGVSPR